MKTLSLGIWNIYFFLCKVNTRPGGKLKNDYVYNDKCGEINHIFKFY